MAENRINPISASDNIRKAYIRYLITTFGLKNQEMARQFKDLAHNTEGLFRGPILEATPKYKKGKSLLDIATEENSFLSKGFLNFAPGLDKKSIESHLLLERELYLHQEDALRRIIGKNRNVVISTGTGSGKTECFLLPVIDYLLKEREANKLGPGVRSLFVYPMNALANDQIFRLRKLLPAETGITFGRYTGQTLQKYHDGVDAYKQENNGNIPQANELFCRDQILGIEPPEGEWPYKGTPVKVGPPHILLTNFAMLEYLLMRPNDSVLFDSGAGNTWRFLVLDEAHIYSGALGTEIGYLIRRLKDRICHSKQGRLTCIATSATIGADNKKTRKTIAESFQNLFGESFEEQDILTGDIVSPKIFLGHFHEWGKGSAEFYNSIDMLLQKVFVSVSSFCDEAKKTLSSTDTVPGWPNRNTIKKTFENIERIETIDDAKAAFLFYILAGDGRLRILIQELEKNPIDLQKAAKIIWEASGVFADMDTLKKKLVILVNLGSRARLTPESAPLLACRYHFFVRSLEGLSICLAKSDNKNINENSPRLMLGRHGKVPDAPGGNAVAFELRACGRCGQSFLHGYLQEDGRFISYVQRSQLDEERKKSTHFVIDLDQVTEPAEDEEPLMDEKPPVSMDDADEDKKAVKVGRTQLGDVQYLCSRCGYISDNNSLSCDYCRKKLSRISTEWVAVRRVSPVNGTVVKVCPACGGQKNYGGSIIRPFSPGDDAAGSVLSQSLMSEIPETSEISMETSPEERAATSRFRGSIQKVSQLKPFGKRRLLAFSDSRQDAAYFATYLDRTSNHIMHRQLILRSARKLLKDNPGIEVFAPNDLIIPLIEEAQSIGLFGLKDSAITKISKVSKWLNAELIGIQRRYGLEGVGLIKWELKYKKELLNVVLREEKGIKTDYNLTASEFVNLLEIFLSELRKQNVLQQLTNVDIKDTYFWPRNRPYTIRLNHVYSPLSIASWHPQSSRNIRSDFIERLYKQMGSEIDKNKTKNLIDDLWELSICFENGIIWEEVPSVNVLWGGKGNDGAVWRLKSDAWTGRLDTEKIYKCDTCGNLSHISLKKVCPTYKCTGKLIPVDPEIEFEDNHYRSLYENTAIPISVSEHTAQLTTQEGAERQHNFSSDKDPLNILSCSTTFELGVDVGELHAVFLRNVPPTIANYVQRSGRAGRRLGATAFVLTFCRSRPHDLGYFDVVNKLIAGKIQPSRINIDNNRIARRHLHAVALSRFWRTCHPELFNGPENKRRGIVKWLFFELEKTGAKLVYDWLLQKPNELVEETNRIFPTELKKELGLDSWAWTTDLVDKVVDENGNVLWEGRLGLAQTELCSEFAEYENLQNDKPSLYQYAERQKRRIRERQILDFLASRNVLPKYGFPVDVVALKLQSKDSWAQRVELDRDLKLALGEYAPGCTLVANGRVIKSYALEKIAGRAWPEYRFAICKECGKFHRTEISHGDVDEVCECGQSMKTSKSTILEGSFVEPVYGFRTQLNEDGLKPVEVRPQRTFSTRVYFSYYKPATVNEPFLSEGSPNTLLGVEIKKRYSRYGVLAVLNPGRANRGFWLCPFCGFGDSVAAHKPKTHKTPWGKSCKGKLKRVFLGHEFQSDVLELRFSGAGLNKYSQGFWLSLTAALLAGTSKALDIQRSDIDGTVLRYGGDYRSFVLYDTVPGGAGHVRRISNNLQEVIEQAFNITENCPDCSRDQSCNSCLRNFNNQYAHDLLKRGEVAEFLSKIISGLYRKDTKGYFSLGLTDSRRWLEQQIRRSKRMDLVMESIPNRIYNSREGIDLYRVITDLSLKGVKVRVFFNKDIECFVNSDPISKISLHSLALLTHMPNIEIYSIQKEKYLHPHLYFESNSEVYAVRWKLGNNPFSEQSDIEISVLKDYTNNIRDNFDSLAKRSGNHRVQYNNIEKILQGTKVIQVKKGSTQSWNDILTPYLPKSIQKVEIYDRFIRNRYQFKSLSMFLEALLNKTESDKVVVEVTTTSEKEIIVKEKFRALQKKYKNSSLNLRYNILAPDKEIPHFRKIQIESNNGNCSIWLDRGLDIFRFNNFGVPEFETLETYFVIEND